MGLCPPADVCILVSKTANRYTACLHMRVCMPTTLMDSCPVFAEPYHQPCFNILHIPCGAFPGRKKPNTHAGQHAHLHSTSEVQIYYLHLSAFSSDLYTHTHTLVPLAFSHWHASFHNHYYRVMFVWYAVDFFPLASWPYKLLSGPQLGITHTTLFVGKLCSPQCALNAFSCLEKRREGKRRK